MACPQYKRPVPLAKKPAGLDAALQSHPPTAKKRPIKEEGDAASTSRKRPCNDALSSNQRASGRSDSVPMMEPEVFSVAQGTREGTALVGGLRSASFASFASSQFSAISRNFSQLPLLVPLACVLVPWVSPVQRCCSLRRGLGGWVMAPQIFPLFFAFGVDAP